jgi:DNA-binding SARP family transcriptional activator
LLTLLALKNRRLAVDAICDALWPDSDNVSASHSLKVIVHRLRAKLGQSVILCRDHGYCLGTEVENDLDSMSLELDDRLKEPLSAVQRRRLETLRRDLMNRSEGELARYEWYLPLRHRLEETLRIATLRLADDALRDGRPHAALLLARDLLDEDGEDEVANEIASSALGALGGSGGARRLGQCP